MFRLSSKAQSTEANFSTISFEFQCGDDESGSCIYENISTPDEFKANYYQLCENKITLVDERSLYVPARSSYSIQVSGAMNGKPFAKTFTDLEQYRFFLLRHKLWPESENRHMKRI